MSQWLGKWFHVHRYFLKWTQEEVWAECSCHSQLDIPDERLNEAYEKIRQNDLEWTE